MLTFACALARRAPNTEPSQDIVSGSPAFIHPLASLQLSIFLDRSLYDCLPRYGPHIEL